MIEQKAIAERGDDGEDSAQQQEEIYIAKVRAVAADKVNAHVDKMFTRKLKPKQTPLKGKKLPKILEESEEEDMYSGREAATFDHAISENNGIAPETQEVEFKSSPTKKSRMASVIDGFQ